MNVLSGVLNNGPSNFGFQPPQQHGNHDPSYHQANGLFLLSQAHQELEKREQSAQQMADNATMAPAMNGNQVNGKRGAKRKSYDASASFVPNPPAMKSNSKRTRSSTTTSNGRRKTSPRTSDGGDDDEDDYMEDDDPAVVVSGPAANGKKNKKPETEEEKRRNFLERNRQAALKCRQRKKQWLQSLQAKVEFLQTENEQLKTALVASRDEISRLSQLAGTAAGSMGPGAQPISMNVSLSSKSGPAPAPPARTSGYGY